MPLAFLLDEHLRGPLWQAILRHNLRGENLLDVVRVGDPDDLPLSADDSTVLAWAEREDRLLLTEDRHTMPAHMQDHLESRHHSPGILIVRTEQSMRMVIDSLKLIAHAGHHDEFANAISYIP
jgi:hypothetical protein